MCELKKDCHWYLIKRPSQRTGCAILSDYQCTKCKCTFYESEDCFQSRQQAHKERMANVPLSKLVAWEEKGYKVLKENENGKAKQ